MMKLVNIKKLFVISTLALSANLLSLNAVDTINLNSDSGVWTNVTGSPSNFSGSGTNFIQWGNPVSGGNQSGYKFVGAAPPTLSLALNTPFILGTFSHLNFPITGNSITSADLNVSAMLSINSTPVSFSGIYHLLHNETPNNTTLFDPNCCNDIVTFQNNVSQLSTFIVGGLTYTINMIGFKTTVNGPLLTEFSTVEGQQNNAFLYAQIQQTSTNVPEPATYLIIASLLAGCALLARRRNAATAK